MAINVNIPIEDAVTDGSLNPVTSNAVFDALAGLTASDLQSVTDVGNTTTNDISFKNTAGILLENNSRLREGTIDANTGGSKGIAQICAVGYELKWEAGSQYVMDGNGVLVREVNHKFNIVPDEYQDSSLGFYVGSKWILDNGDVYVCTDSTATNAVWEIVPNADWNATTGSSAIANKPSIPSAQVNSDWNAVSGVAEILNKPTIPLVDSVPTDASANAVSSNGVFDALANKVDKNTAIVGATKTKITYDAKGLVTAGADATKSDVGLANVDNTSDANKPVSTATQTALNAKQDTLVSATNIKTINGTTLLGSGDLVVGSSSGIFGIANASGVYTYYATFTLAMAAATSGQTIEMFADVTETGAVEITLKDGVNINGNGHTYTLNNSGTSNAFKVTNSTSIDCSILNLNVIRIGSTLLQSTNACLYSGTSTSGNIYLTGSKFTNSGSGSGIAIGSASTISIYDATTIANTAFGSIYFESSSGAKAYNSIGISTSGAGINCYIGGDLYNCTGISSLGIGIDGAGGTTAGSQYNCIGISTSGTAFTTGLISINCIGRSISGNGILSLSPSKVYSCVGLSVSGRGIQNAGATIYNFQGISSSNVGILLQSTTSLAYNCFSKSDSSYSIWGWQGSKIYNSIIECNWNNVGGNGIQGISGFITNTIVNCVFKLSNVGAPYLFNGGTAQAISMRGNTYQGGGAFNVNLTQAIVAVEDAQGNIFL